MPAGGRKGSGDEEGDHALQHDPSGILAEDESEAVKRAEEQRRQSGDEMRLPGERAARRGEKETG